MVKGKARDGNKEALWRRRLRQQVRSGQSVRAWCRLHRVTETAFYWWRRELARRDAGSLSLADARGNDRRLTTGRDAEQKPTAQRDTEHPSASFVPVHVATELARDDDGMIEILLTDGQRVRISGAVERGMLSEVLEALALAGCAKAERRPC